MNRPIVFLDTETTSLRPDRRFWEVGVIVRGEGVDDIELSWFVNIEELDLGNADRQSLAIGKFYDRHPQARSGYATDINVAGNTVDGTYFRGLPNGVHGEASILWDLEHLTRDAIIVGAVPDFGTDVLGRRMREHRLCPAWHYHLVDVETLAAGQLGMRPPWSFDQVLAEYGITVDEEQRHTALGDARLNRALFDAVYTVADQRLATAVQFITTQKELS